MTVQEQEYEGRHRVKVGTGIRWVDADHKIWTNDTEFLRTQESRE